MKDVFLLKWLLFEKAIQMTISKFKQIILLMYIVLILPLSGGCHQSLLNDDNVAIYAVNNLNAPYPTALANQFPHTTIDTLDVALLPATLETSSYAVECLANQAHGYLASGAADYYYEHYLATVVIAIDRTQVNDTILGWQDLMTGNYRVVFANNIYNRYTLMAMSYGLDDHTFQLDHALVLFNQLYRQGRIHFASDASGMITEADFLQPAVAIMFDYQAAQLAALGTELEIIVPIEGTITLSGGLLSQRSIVLDNRLLASDLLANNYRLTDGRALSTYYPNDYGQSLIISDYEAFNLAMQRVGARLRREGQGKYLFTTADGDEHALSFLIFFVVVVFWGGKVYFTTLHKAVRKTMLTIIAMLILRVALRYVKALFDSTSAIGRYIWYSYYIPLLLLPILLLALAWQIDKPENENRWPRWLGASFIFSMTFILVVLSNDWHQLMFRFSPNFTGWLRNYSYGPAYYLFFGYFSLALLIGVSLLIHKAGKVGRDGLLPMVTALSIGGLFFVGDLIGIQFIREMQTPFVSALLLLLFFETALATGFIPSNHKYSKLLAYAPIDMSIISNVGVVFTRTNYQLVTDYAENSQLISGGVAIERIDIAKEKRLQEALNQKIERLSMQKVFLQKRSQLDDEMTSLLIQKELYSQIDNIVSNKIKTIAQLVDEIVDDEPIEKSRIKLARASVLANYVKSRSNLILTQHEVKTMHGMALYHILSESKRCAKLAGVDLSVHIADDIYQISDAILLYDCFFYMLEWTMAWPSWDVTARLINARPMLKMTILLSREQPWALRDYPVVWPLTLCRAIENKGGHFNYHQDESTLTINITWQIVGGDW